MKKAKILHIIPNTGLGGAQKVFSQLSHVLSKKYLVKCIAFDNNAPELYNKEISYEYLNVEKSHTKVSKIINLFKRIGRLKKIKKEYKPSISISHLEGADLINVLTGRYDKKIVVLHGSKIADVKYKGIYHFFRHRILNPIVIKKADQLVCVSEGIGNEIVNVYKANPKKISVINNFFEIDKIQLLSNQPLSNPLLDELFSNFQVLVNCARIDVQKNQIALLDVYNNLEANIKNKTKLLIIGDGSERNNVINYASSLGLRVFDSWNEELIALTDVDIFFLGKINNPFPFIKRAKLFILTSGWEGFPLALGEAMICGTPVISTDCPTGPRELLSKVDKFEYTLDKTEHAEYGILMPNLTKSLDSYKHSVAIWSKEIEKLLDNSKLLAQYSEKAMNRMKEFSPEKIEEKWIRLIENLINDNNGE